ncbi:MAG: hypothetical protein AB7E55_19765 [Pigmentiphaga sp.]
MSAAYHQLGTVQLPRGMVWVDEHDWVASEKSVEHSVSGALLIDGTVRQAGRPITLEAADDAGWISRSALQALRALANSPTAAYTLTLADGREFDVQFAPGNPITARPVGRPELPAASHPYVATVRLIEI